MRQHPMPTSQSFWSVTYGGPQHGVMLKKLERLGGFKALDPHVERWVQDGQRIAHVSFLVAHPLDTFQNTHAALLQLAWRLAPTWRMTRLGEHVEGEWSVSAVGPNHACEAIVAGCQRVVWTWSASQTYTHPKYLGGQANHW